ncbi:hypothetical protein NP233_g12034 [Leucocoprinus birnbaumii]|uniref:Acyl-CoA oxidase C-terminal domain-containing protein n=1 Tax=Leucocoprinus birnbaumii TaxID=56174 RepID=A0AAD5VFA5_9AGAR|nr:hypothetical protein NP233_g12034 [Leucocoprinus birnbaumii]
MKAYSAQTGAHDAEDSRRVCGGHGYSVLSGLPDIVCDLLATPTMEGDNHVMYQQTARYLVKQAKRVRDGRSADSSVAYLVAGYAHQRTKDGTQCPLFSKDFGYPENLLDILHHRAARCIFECEERLRLAEGDGSKPEVVWNKYMLDLILAARYHIECFVLEAFIHSASCIRDVALRRVLMQLCTLYALTTIESPFVIGSSAFLEDRYISRAQLEDIRDHVHGLLDALAPEAIGLTDAWDFSDASLKSALGRKDGNVYEILLDWTKQIPSVDGLADNPRRQWSSHPYPARSRL